jgi:hypothetical protein
VGAAIENISLTSRLSGGHQHSALFYQRFGKNLMLVAIAIGIDVSIQRSKTTWGRSLNNAGFVRLGLELLDLSLATSLYPPVASIVAFPDFSAVRKSLC